MARLIVKSPYIQCGGSRNAGGYLRYIGTRERVELLPDDRPPTRRQEQLIRKLVDDFPNTKTLDEYADYAAQPTKARASALITAAVETHWEDAQRSDVYMKYIATRPRAERLGSHGLFGDEDYADLRAAMDELEHYTGNVWTHIISLQREDATRLGYDNAKAWRDLLRAHRNEIAAAMHIPPNDFRWYAAFHNEGHHPHVHMMVWSVKPGQAYLNRDGIRQIRSQLTNDVFKHEMLQLYEQKSASRDALVREARRALMELADRMQHTLANGPALEDRMQALAQALDEVCGKHQYGYLKKPVKRQVDEIVDALEGFPLVRECYDRWLDLQDQVDSYYKDEKRTRCKLSEQKEFRAIKNAVIQIADQINAGTVTFEDERMRDEPDAFADGWYEFHDLYAVILDENSSIEDRDENAERLRAYAEDGDACAQYYLGALYRDGGVLIPDDEQAEKWFRLSTAQGNDCAAYALAKLLQEQGRTVEAVKWMEQSAQAGNRYAQYQLAKLYLVGDGVTQDVEKALELLEASAQQGNPFAAYLLGKLYLDGQLVEQDVACGMAYMEQAAVQGNDCARFFVNRQDSLKPTAVMLSVTQLLHHMGGVFRDNSLPQSGAPLMRIDRKRFAELARRKGYQAARNYAREMQEENEFNGQTMSAPW